MHYVATLITKPHCPSLRKQAILFTDPFYSGAQALAEHHGLRFFGKSINARNFGNDVTYVRRTDCRGGVGEAGQPLGTKVFRQFSLAGNCVAALHLATRVYLAGNHISDEQRDKEQERLPEKRRLNLRNSSQEILERSRGRRRRENFNENQRKAERIAARDKTLTYNG